MDDPRKQMENLLLQISILNDQKRDWQKAWEGEKKRQGDPHLEKPLELIVINKKLGPLYGAKEDLIRQYPFLEAEYGGRKKTATKISPLHVPKTQAEKAAKKARYLANREAKRLENQKRSAKKK